MRRRNPEAGLVVFWVKMMQRGYTRSITGLYRVLRKQGQMAVKPPNPKYVPKPYELMYYPGQRVQIDVKHVPASCLVGEAAGKKFYQYTAIDEYSRFRYLEAFEEASTYTSKVFLENMLKAFPFKVECVQTDNGFEFTKRFGSDSNSPHCLSVRSNSVVSATSSSNRLHPDITVRWSAHIARTTNISTQLTGSIHSMILKLNWQCTVGNTMPFLCALSNGRHLGWCSIIFCPSL